MPSRPPSSEQSGSLRRSACGPQAPGQFRRLKRGRQIARTMLAVDTSNRIHRPPHSVWMMRASSGASVLPVVASSASSAARRVLAETVSKVPSNMLMPSSALTHTQPASLYGLVATIASRPLVSTISSDGTRIHLLTMAMLARTAAYATTEPVGAVVCITSRHANAPITPMAPISCSSLRSLRAFSKLRSSRRARSAAYERAGRRGSRRRRCAHCGRPPRALAPSRGEDRIAADLRHGRGHGARRDSPARWRRAHRPTTPRRSRRC